MFKRIYSYGWAAIMMALALATGVFRVASGAVGAADDLRAVPDPAWWQEAWVWFLTIPAWMPFTAFFVFAAIFAIQLAIDGHKASDALKTVKSSNERAWAFEPEFRDAMDALATQSDDFSRVSKELQSAIEAMRNDFGNLRTEFGALREDVDQSVNQFENYVDGRADEAASREAMIVHEDHRRFSEIAHKRLEELEAKIVRIIE